MQLNRAGKTVRVVVAYRILLGVFGVSVRIVEPALVETQVRQGKMGPEQRIEPVERRSDPKGCLETLDGLLCIIPETV